MGLGACLSCPRRRGLSFVCVCWGGVRDKRVVLNFTEMVWESGGVLLCQIWSRPQGPSATAVELLPLACKVAVPSPLAGSLEPSCHLALLGFTEHGVWPVTTTPSFSAGAWAFEKSHPGQGSGSLSWLALLLG